MFPTLAPDSRPHRGYYLAWVAYGGALLVLLLLIYSPAVDAPFYLDSRQDILSDGSAHMVELSWESVGRAVRPGGIGWIDRPLARLSLALTYYRCGADPSCYRLGNIAIHWAASLALLSLFLAVARLPRVVTTCPSLARSLLPIALVATALWSLHPIQTNAVTYVIQRMTSLSGLFAFLAVGAYLRARGTPGGWSWPWAAAAATAFALATASKEIGLLVLPAVLAAEYTVLRDGGEKPRALALALGAGALLVLGGWAVSLGGRLSATGIEAEFAGYGFTAWERLLTQVRLQPRYLALLLVPNHQWLTLDADVPLSTGFLSPPSTLAAALLLAAAVGVAFWAARWRPVLSLGIFWFLLWQAIEGTVFPLELYYEHRMYVGSAFLYLGLAALGTRLAARGGAARVAAAAALALALVASAGGTWARNTVWADPVRFWRDNVVKAPAKLRPYVNLAEALLAKGAYAEAEPVLARAEALAPLDPAVQVNRAAVDKHFGREEEALARYRRVIDLGGPTAAMGHYGVASVLVKRGAPAEALGNLEASVRANPRYGDAWTLMGVSQLQLGDLGAAERSLARAVAVDPSHVHALGNLGIVMAKTGRLPEAEALFSRAVLLAPGRADLRANLDRLRQHRGR